jgi:hypothetical protein
LFAEHELAEAAKGGERHVGKGKKMADFRFVHFNSSIKKCFCKLGMNSEDANE